MENGGIIQRFLQFIGASSALAGVGSAAISLPSLTTVLSSPSYNAPFGLLPPELVEIIVSFLPLKPRVHIVSLVAKPWHRAVYRSITRLVIDKKEVHLQPLILRMPSLIALQVLVAQSEKGVPLPSLPSTLRTLQVHDYRYGTLDYRAAHQHVCSFNLPHLTSLSLVFNDDCIAIQPLLRQCSSSLRQLALWFLHYRPEVTADLISTPLPNVHTFRLKSEHIGVADYFVSSVLPQLVTNVTCLKLLTVVSTKVTSLELPALKRLRIGTKSTGLRQISFIPSIDILSGLSRLSLALSPEWDFTPYSASWCEMDFLQF